MEECRFEIIKAEIRAEINSVGQFPSDFGFDDFEPALLHSFNF
jgi:hypothetical protein